MNDMRKLMEAASIWADDEVADQKSEVATQKALDQIKTILLRLRKVHKNQMVKMVGGQYNGRYGVCKGVNIRSMGDTVEFDFTIYVLRSDGTDVLNTDAASRSFQPKEAFEWLDDRWDGSTAFKR